MKKPNTECCDCKQPLYRKPSFINKWKKSYCSDCRKKHMRNIAKIQNINNFNTYIANWKEGLVDGMKGEYSLSSHINKYLRIKYDNKCCKCGWHEVNPFTNKVPLEVEHIDGNYRNNDENNLVLLCSNCHSLTATYKGANRGNGRKERKKYS